MGDPIGIAGTGRLAQALGRLLRERGQPIRFIAGRDATKSRAAAAFIGGAESVSLDLLASRARRILIAVSDGALPVVAARIAKSGMSAGLVLHTCGAWGPEPLAVLSSRGVSCAALHPLQTVFDPEQGVVALPGCAFGITGEGPAAEWARSIVTALGGRPLGIPAERRALYHAAAVMASNYIVGLIDAAACLMQSAGIPEAEAIAAISPLVTASAGNALRAGPGAALTGPIARGDAETVALHFKALATVSPVVREVYRSVARHTLDLARRRGLDESVAMRLETIIRKDGEFDGGKQ